MKCGQDGSILTRANNSITEICKTDYSFKVGADYKLSIANNRDTYIQMDDTYFIGNNRDYKIMGNDNL